jgi:hypothetical protein
MCKSKLYVLNLNLPMNDKNIDPLKSTVLDQFVRQKDIVVFFSDGRGVENSLFIFVDLLARNRFVIVLPLYELLKQSSRI